MIVSFKPQEVTGYAPKLVKVEHELNDHLEGLEGSVTFIKRLSREDIIAATTKAIYFLNVSRGIRILKTLERPKGAKFIDATPRRLVFGLDRGVLVTDLNGKELFEVPLSEPPIAIAAYRDLIATAHESQVHVFRDEEKIGSIRAYSASSLRLIKHRRSGALIIGTSIGRLLVVNVDNMRTIYTAKPFDAPVKHIAALSDGHAVTMVAATSREAIVANTYGLRRRLDVDQVDSVAISTNVAYVGSREYIYSFTFGGRLVAKRLAHRSAVTAMDARPILASGSYYGGIAVWSSPIKRLGKRVVELDEGFVGMINDGRVFFYRPGIAPRFYRFESARRVAYTGRSIVVATDRDVVEILPSRTRYVDQEPSKDIAASKRLIALLKDGEIVLVSGDRRSSIKVEAKRIKLLDAGDRSILVAIGDNFVNGYAIFRDLKTRLLRTIDIVAKDADVAFLRGSLILALAGRYISLWDVTRRPRRIATILRQARRVLLRRSDGRLLLLALTDEGLLVRDITEMPHVGYTKASMDSSAMSTMPGIIASGSYGLELFRHEGYEKVLSRISRGIVDESLRLEGYEDLAGFQEEPAKRLLEAKEKGSLGGLVRALVDKGLATLRGNVAIIEVEPKNVDGLELIVRPRTRARSCFYQRYRRP